MKHDLSITILLIVLFLASHIIGFYIIKHYLPSDQSLPLGIEKLQLNEKTSYIPIFITLLIATGLALVLVKFSAMRLWKFWYFLSILMTLIIAFSAFTKEIIALVLAIILALLKIFKPNILTHNLTEIFMYGGLAAIFVPVLNIFSITILLLLISVYDMIAVWKTKHMISMAKFQTKSKLFAGLLVNYNTKRSNEKINKINSKSKTVKQESNRQAILGGGDIAFPLMFSGVILKTFGFIPALITSLTAAIALLFLFFIAEKKKFYPAMPFITAGSLLGYLIILLAF